VLGVWGMATLFLITAIILYFFSPKKEIIRWAIFFLMCASLRDFSKLPSITYLHEIITPYGFIMFSIVYSERMNRRTNNVLALIILIPVILLMVVPFLRSLDAKLDLIVLLLWVIPVYCASCFLLVLSCLREKKLKERNLRWITIFVIIPPTFVNILLENIDRVLGFHFNAQWNLLIFEACAFVILIIFLVRYGLFGIKVKFEKKLFDQTINGISSGTSMLNHALKNRIINIDMLAERMKFNLQSPQTEQLKDIELIQTESQQMMNMIKRIQKQIEDIEIVDGLVNLEELVNQSLKSNHLLLDSKNIEVVTDYTINVNLMCDNFHLQEVCNNLIRNAVDAMEGGIGKLSIKVSEALRGYSIDFSDNGAGISKEAADKIFDPFFSTKNREDNFGLGLSYCYLVMQKHGGTIHLSSLAGESTTFSIQLPKNRKV
jgi:two-component system NtrC family sensor kinase